MARLPVIAAAPILPGLALAQPTDDAARCQAAAGSYLCRLNEPACARGE